MGIKEFFTMANLPLTTQLINPNSYVSLSHQRSTTVTFQKQSEDKSQNLEHLQKYLCKLKFCTTIVLKDLRAQNRSDFLRLLLKLGSDQLIPERRKNQGVIVLVSEIKTVMFLKALVMYGDIDFIAISKKTKS